MEIKKLTLASLLIAVGVVSSHIIYIPIGLAKAFPVQHGINLLSAVFFGPFYGVIVAFLISLIRNIVGTGSLLAFPGSMIGAYMAGILYQKTKMPICAMVGEVLGTGILGGAISYPAAKYLMGKQTALLFFIGPFLLSSAVGVFIGYIVFRAVMKVSIIKKQQE